MPKTLADARTRLVGLVAMPAGLLGDPPVVTAVEATAGVRLDNHILKSDYRLSATGSDTVNEPELSAEGNAVVYGASNYEGNLTVFRYLDVDGQPDAATDVAYDLLREKGTTLWLIERVGPKASVAFTIGDIVDVYEVVTDNPQQPSDRTGFIKRVTPFGVQNAYLNIALT
jgi:hypothetical protein